MCSRAKISLKHIFLDPNTQDAEAGTRITRNMQLRVLQACLAVSDKALQLTALYNSILNTQALVFATANSTAMARDFRAGNPATVWPHIHPFTFLAAFALPPPRSVSCSGCFEHMCCAIAACSALRHLAGQA